jgi:hypothetical protein
VRFVDSNDFFDWGWEVARAAWPTHTGSTPAAGGAVPLGPVAKKRGRPRKYRVIDIGVIFMIN